MKTAILLCTTLLTVTATLTSAAPGVNLRWNSCLGDGGAINRNFACNTNAGTNSLRASFELGADLLRVSGVAPTVDLASASPVLPEWWEFKNPGSCRTLSLSIGAYDGNTCFDWAIGQASMNIAAYQVGGYGANHARILILNAVVLNAIQNLGAGIEYTAFALNISNAGTTGTSCTGCTVPVCIVFNSIDISTADLTSVKLSGPTNGTDAHYVSWQGGAGITVPGRPPGCPAATPSRNATWGEVKSLYR